MSTGEGQPEAQIIEEDQARWEPWDVDTVVEVLGDVDARWWFTGGHALELHVGRQWRIHEDIDVGICRDDLQALRVLLSRYEIFVSARGSLVRWTGRDLAAEHHANNLWVRDADGAWRLDVVVGAGTEQTWIYRRDPTLIRAWQDAVLVDSRGRRYLAPELQMLFKSKDRRAKDDVDAGLVLPTLTVGAQAMLQERLPAEHPWQRLLNAHA